MKLQLCKHLNLKINGKVTGKQYIFRGAGSIVEVDDEDGEIMKMKMSRQPCCSGGPPTPYFQVVEDAPIIEKKVEQIKTSTRRTKDGSNDWLTSRNSGSG